LAKNIALSPDGQQLAFTWNGGSGPHFSIYVKLVGTEESLRLTKQASIDFNPVWSPDGHYIAFCRIQKGQTGIYIIPAFGGAERRVRETHWEEREFYEVFWYFGRLSWSPDGKLLAFSDRASSKEPSAIFLLSLESLEVHRLTAPQIPGDYNPVFSPDGRTLAFNRGSHGVTSIYTVAVSGGEEQCLISGPQFGWGLAWTPDGRNIIFAKAGWLANAGWLWKMSLRGGEPERLQFGQEGVEPSIRGNRLVYARQVANLNIWRRELNSSHSAGPPDRFISSTRMESGPQFSPDGSKIAFESTRSGAYEVWMCRSDGTDLIQLTRFNSVTGTPRWSPDGQQIAFDSCAPGNAEIFVMDSRGGSPRRLTNEPSTDVVPSWSRDGRWLYFASDRIGGWEVWKMPSTGGPAMQVTRHGGFAAFESPDGRFLYYAKGPTVAGLWRIPTDGGEEIEVINSLEAGYWGYWAVVEDGIYYLDTTAEPGIAFFNTTSQRTTRVFDLENRPAREATGLAVSSDQATILYTQLDELSRDIILVENFR
jgi:Tol biopolymer transport system component